MQSLPSEIWYNIALHVHDPHQRCLLLCHAGLPYNQLLQNPTDIDTIIKLDAIEMLSVINPTSITNTQRFQIYSSKILRTSY